MNTIRAALMACSLAIGSLPVGLASAAPVTFEHFCVSLADCDNDAGFTVTITLDDGVVDPGGVYNTQTDGGAGFLGWTASSSIGNGFSISGAGS